MIALSPAMREESRKIRGTSPFLWLYEIVFDVTPTARTLTRLLANPEPMIFSGTSYYPFPVGQSELTEDDERTLPVFDLVLSHASREFSRFLEVGRGLKGAAVTGTLTHAALAAAGDLVRAQTAFVQAVHVDEQNITLQCGLDMLVDREFPPEQLSRTRCSARYFDLQTCGVRPTPAMIALHPTCPKTFTACVERGLAERAEGWPNMHPRRIRSFVSIPRVVRT